MMNSQDGPIKFGDYYLIDKMAIGGMAEIWRAKSLGLEGFERIVAIKCILPSYTQNPEFNSMFIDEARIASTLNHSNIVRITNFGVIDNKYYHEMEFVDGRNLRQILQKCKEEHIPFPLDSGCYIMSEVCKGLHYAHTKHDSVTNEPLNIIHRDMSPQNIMTSFEGEVKIIDWGIAKAKGKIEETRAGVLKGKFGYMSPEQAEGEDLDIRSDIFSVGIVLYEVLTGERLFIADNEINTLKKIKEGIIPLPSRVNPEIDKELEGIMLKALARPRLERYQTCYDLHEDLVKYLHKKFPAYNSLKLSKFIKETFSNEIIADRKRVHEREQSVPSFSSSYSGRAYGDKTRISSSTGTGSVPERSYPERSFGDSRSRSYPQDEGERTLLADSATGASVSSSMSISEGQDATVTVEESDVSCNPPASEGAAAEKIPSTSFKPEYRKKIIRPKILILASIFAGLLLYLLYGGGEEQKKEQQAQLPPVQEAQQQQEIKEMESLQRGEEPQAPGAVIQRPVEPSVQPPVEAPMQEVPAQEQAVPQQPAVQQTVAEPQQPVAQQPAAQKAELSLASTPVNAQVLIDGSSRGMTPITLDDLEIGKRYELTLEAPGFEAVKKYFTLRKQDNNLVLPLSPVASAGVSYLSINVEPPVLIYIDGKLASSYRSLYMYRVEPGTRTVRFVNEKLRIDHTTRIQVAKGQQVTKHITLK